MSNLRVEHRHTLSTDEARERVRALGDYFQNKHGVRVQWTGDDNLTLQGKYAMFSFNAQVTLLAGAIAIEAPDPGMLLRNKAREYLEGKLKKYLDTSTPVDALPRRLAVVIVLHEESMLASRSTVGQDTEASAEAARAAGIEVRSFSSDFELWGSAEEAFEGFEPCPPTPTLWVGYIPSVERYREVFEAAARRGMVLLNSPEQHQEAMEFPRFYPKIADLTARSVVVTREDQCEEAARELDLPVFVKGALQSLKGKGFAACIARTPEELRERVRLLLSQERYARGSVVVRELLLLRHEHRDASGFPRGREFRVFCLRGEPLAQGYYWHDDDPLMQLSEQEERDVRALAAEASRRLEAPYLAVDVGQLDDGSWRVIEVGDAQFAGVSRTDRAVLFSALRDRL